MRIVRRFLSLFLLSGVLFALPAQTPLQFSEEKWQTYTRQILVKLYPEEQEKIATMQIVITYSYPDMLAGVSNDFKVMNIASYLLTDMLHSEDEYAAVLAHEFAHPLLHHVSTSLVKPDSWMTGMAEINLPLLEKQENEADRLALNILEKRGYRICALAEILKTVSIFRGWEKESQDPVNRINLERLQFAEHSCEARNVGGRVF